MATIKIVLDQRRVKKDGTFPLVIRVRHLKEFFDIKTNLSILPNKYDAKNQRVLDDVHANFHLEELKENYSKRIRDFHKENINIAFVTADLKKYVLQKPSELVTIESFWNEIIQQLLDSNKTGNARSYKTTLSVFSKIIDCSTTFNRITYKDLILIETTLYKRGVTTNTIAVYMRTFRAVCNRAILYNYVNLDWYPFKKYKISKEKTTPKVVSIETMKKYFDLNLSVEDKLYKVWCVGKLIFMLRGINLTDLLLLKKSNISSNRIIYKREKTGKMYSIKILPHAHDLLIRFSDDTEYLLGFVKSKNQKTTAAQLEQYIDYRKKLNKKLKKIGELIQSEVSLTTYVFRYTYANIAKQLGFSKDLIAEALGHEYGNSITGIYLEMFDLEMVDSMNERIINEVS